jgi:putative glycosyltransferase (TIGR04348 family)
VGGLPHVRRLSIGIVTPAEPGSRQGNRITALRWARCLRALGHRVQIRETWASEEWDVLVALHAVKSRDAVERFKAWRLGAPIVVGLAGTDVYGAAELAGLEDADRIVALQPLAVRKLPGWLQARARTIVQSARAPAFTIAPPRGVFAVHVLAHLRPVKDPFLAADASHLLPPSSRVAVFHLGAALDEDHRSRARGAEARAPRWRWLGDLPRAEALARVAGGELLCVTSRSEGGANVVSEAIACGVPVISTDIEGSRGILGDDHPGYFPVGDRRALAALLSRCETDEGFLGELRARSLALRRLVDPAREVAAWKDLLAGLSEAA